MNINLTVFASDGVYLAIILVSVIAIAVYFLPTIVAFKRSHRNRWIILLLNIFGATIIFWVIALIWAFNKVDDPIKGGYQTDGQEGDRTL
ncbi:MAG: superinfection immunity protein [Flavobacteriaceae bacterium]|nr:superinfection immunity protein [Flavobacteriaceae bacterium]